MSDPAEISLAAKLTKSPHLRWYPGMFGYSPSKDTYQRFAGNDIWVDADDGFIRNARFPDLQPVLSDAPTCGALLRIAQVIHNAPKAYVKWHELWECYFVGGFQVDVPTPRGSSEGEALAIAILQAKP